MSENNLKTFSLQYGESTVYVHGFGTTNDNEIDHYNDYNNEVPPASNYIYDKPAYGHYQAPVYHPKPYAPAPTYYDKGGYLQGYGYGHIDGYGNARHGYGFGKRYGYEAPVYNEYAHAPVYNEYPHAPAPVQAPAPAGFQPGPLGVPPSLSGPHTPSLGHGFGYGFTHF